VKLAYQNWGSIDGRDIELDPVLAPVAASDLYGGERLNLLAGLTWMPRRATDGKIVLEIEGGAPLYQSLNGPQLGQEWQASAAVYWRF